MSTRPEFVALLLDRTLPQLSPPKLTDKSNPPFSVELQNQIADLKCHPLLESTLHLMNDDLFSAHFLLRKMQEDETGKWLHAILHQAEGDLEKNAKLWYKEVDPDVLGQFWIAGPGKTSADAAVDNMYAIMRVKAGKASATEAEQARRTRWEELLRVMQILENQVGWAPQDAKNAYTSDTSASHTSRVLGEGYRTFDKSGWSDR